MVRFTESTGIVPHLGREEAERRHQYYLGPEHLLLGLLRDAEDPVEVDLQPMDHRRRSMAGLPHHGPRPVRLLVEAQGLTLDQLRTALLEQLDQGQ